MPGCALTTRRQVTWSNADDIGATRASFLFLTWTRTCCPLNKCRHRCHVVQLTGTKCNDEALSACRRQKTNNIVPPHTSEEPQRSEQEPSSQGPHLPTCSNTSRPSMSILPFLFSYVGAFFFTISSRCALSHSEPPHLQSFM